MAQWFMFILSALCNLSRRRSGQPIHRKAISAIRCHCLCCYFQFFVFFSVSLFFPFDTFHVNTLHIESMRTFEHEPMLYVCLCVKSHWFDVAIVVYCSYAYSNPHTRWHTHEITPVIYTAFRRFYIYFSNWNRKIFTTSIEECFQ